MNVECRISINEVRSGFTGRVIGARRIKRVNFNSFDLQSLVIRNLSIDSFISRQYNTLQQGELNLKSGSNYFIIRRSIFDINSIVGVDL